MLVFFVLALVFLWLVFWQVRALYVGNADFLQEIEEEKKNEDTLNMIPEKYRASAGAGANPSTTAAAPSSNALSPITALQHNSTSVVLRNHRVQKPTWHAPWKLMRVIAGHQGWVRCIAVDPMNRWFVTGSNDRTIKFWDLVEAS